MQIPAPIFLRAKQILGDKRKGIPPIFPVSHTTWWNGVKTGRFPAPIRFGKRMTMWKAEDIYRLLEQGAQ